ncbi:hypothetical protein ACWE42_24145, partial [Sutcliffiella cohnii]
SGTNKLKPLSNFKYDNKQYCYNEMLFFLNALILKVETHSKYINKTKNSPLLSLGEFFNV